MGIDDGKMILLSDIAGCQDKNNEQYLTKLVCKPQFFKSLQNFMVLGDNNNNKISFVGNYFDKGSYVMSTIMRINKLMGNYGDRINLILSLEK